ncbi:hypothetical protein CerSpe_093070 [Prunus speciosa]
MKATGSLSMVVCLFLVVGVWVVVVPMAKGDTTPSQCKEEKDLLMGACKNAILEKLYNPNHIVIGCEHVKLSSIQLSLGDCAAVDSINRKGFEYSR